MKYILFVLLGSSLQSFAQECKLVKDIDPYTKEVKLTTGFIQLEGATLSIDANKQEVDCLFSIVGIDKCFSDASTAALFFEGSKVKMTQRNSGSMNCEGFFHFLFKNNTLAAPLLKKMATVKVTKIVFTGNNKAETTVTLTGEQQQVLLDLAACMVTEAPKLLQ